jgi:hypothetical protein
MNAMAFGETLLLHISETNTRTSSAALRRNKNGPLGERADLVEKKKAHLHRWAYFSYNGFLSALEENGLLF